MGLHILPIIAFFVAFYMQAYNHAYYQFCKDQMYGFETLFPSFAFIIFLAVYYGAWAFFTFLV